MRELAGNIRQLASGLALDNDRQRLTSFAEELERQAEALEKEAAQGRDSNSGRSRTLGIARAVTGRTFGVRSCRMLLRAPAGPWCTRSARRSWSAILAASSSPCPNSMCPTTRVLSSARTAARAARLGTAPKLRPVMPRSLGPRRLSSRRRTDGRRPTWRALGHCTPTLVRQHRRARQLGVGRSLHVELHVARRHAVGRQDDDLVFFQAQPRGKGRDGCVAQTTG